MSIHWTFTDEPLPQAEQETTFEYFSTEHALGSELDEQEHVEGRITLGRWHTWRLTHDTGAQSTGDIDEPPEVSSAGEMETDQVDGSVSSRSFYLVRIPFTLHPPYGDQRYDEVRFEIQLEDTESARPYEIFPHDITVDEDVKRAFILSPSLKFKGVEGAIGSAALTVEYTNLRPVISAYGVGESEFYWIYDDPRGSGIPTGTKYSLVVLDVSSGTAAVSGTLSWQLVLKKRLFGKLRSKKMTAEAYPFTWRLDESAMLPGAWLPV